MNPYQAGSHARRVERTSRPVLALVREPDAEPCPRCGRAVATVQAAGGEVRVAMPAGRLPRVVEARPLQCSPSPIGGPS
jgi:hypothetical protein